MNLSTPVPVLKCKKQYQLIDEIDEMHFKKYYPAPHPAYTYLYNIINILFIFGVQLFNLFSYLSINLNLKTNTVIISSLPS